MRANRRVRRLVHRRHPGAVELARVPLDVTLERHRSHRGFEVEEAALRSLLLLYAEPVREVVRVGQRRGQPDDSHRALSARGYEPHAAHDHLEDRTAVGAEKVDLVDDHQRNLGDVRPSLPITRDAVPLLGRAHDDVRTLKRAHVRGVVARQLHQLLVQHHAQFMFPILDAFADERLERRDVNHLPAGVVPERRQHRELRADSLTRARGRAEEHVRFGVKERVERLRLDLVEKLKLALVQLEEFLAAERGVLRREQRLSGHRWQVQELSVRGSLVG
mmetsp:Transcript_8569/g.38962  ORF Transcript_8569/g.38962 Transcript_8569/m.38962 type:complete len:276 (-) Transcript_8569:3149-3976(-)